MSRIRSIKPEFFRHEALYEAERQTHLPLRLAFAGMWTVADREGRFRWRPRVIKLDVLPFDDVDFESVLDALLDRGFLGKYTVGADTFGNIPSFSAHQHVNQRESASVIPAPDSDGARTCAHVPPARGREGEGEGKGREHTMPADAGGSRENGLSAEGPQFFSLNGLAHKLSTGALVLSGSDFGSPDDVPVVPDRYPQEFEELWQMYREQIGEKNASKARSYKFWKKLSDSDRENCLVGLSRYCIWATDERKKRVDVKLKHLETFINSRSWEPYLEVAQ